MSLRAFMPQLGRYVTMTIKRLGDVVREVVAFSLWLAAVMLNMASVLWLGFQGLKWLHDGYWTHQPPVMAWVHGVCPGACAFVTNPHSWYGAAKLARLLSQVPCGLALALIGIALGVLSVSISHRRSVAPGDTKVRARAA
ncbi:hypothetical protein DWU98_06090 [Dyella monticola]|uniref:Uncharacterized protein n=1 Tax=Dyella monticola TaxID=1927958 RepID=A0A370X623_9GAMM|nr:hypothetical protein [Dyella monticola]RDS83873.1 hypothetical protein DWU98_06090 [Dyella monticola]